MLSSTLPAAPIRPPKASRKAKIRRGVRLRVSAYSGMFCNPVLLLRCCAAALADEVFEIADLVDGEVELAGEDLDLGLGAAVDVEVELAAEAVLGVLTVLAHHDDRRLECGERGAEEVE